MVVIVGGLGGILCLPIPPAMKRSGNQQHEMKAIRNLFRNKSDGHTITLWNPRQKRRQIVSRLREHQRQSLATEDDTQLPRRLI